MVRLVCLVVAFVLLVVEAASDRASKTSKILQKQARNCSEAGWTRCCKRGDCLASAGQCFCDHSCHEFGDCCEDISTTCPKTAPTHVCAEGKIRLIKEELRICTNGSFHSLCSLPKESLSRINLQGHDNIQKKQAGDGTDGGSGGGGADNMVEIGFTESQFNASESDATVLVCVEVKTGELSPAESAGVVLSTKPGTAQGDVDYECQTEQVYFDGNTYNDTFCVEISIIDDVLLEPVEYFSVSLSKPSGSVTLDELSSTATVFIVDSTSVTPAPGDSCVEVGLQNKCCDVSCQSHNFSCSCDNLCFRRGDCCEDIFEHAVEMEESDLYVNEGSTVRVCIELIGRFDTTTEDIVLNTIIAPSGLTDEEDYHLTGSGEVVFPSNNMQKLTLGDTLNRCIEITAINDTHVEGEHTLTVEIVSASPPSVVTCSTSKKTVLHIIDDDVMEVSPVAWLDPLAEQNPLNVCIRASGVDCTSINLHINTTLSSEQGKISSASISFRTGELVSGIKCYNAMIDNDILEVEPWELTLTVHTSPPYDRYVHLTTPNFLTVPVSDNEVDAASVHFESARAEVTGGHRTAVCVILDGVPNGGMTVDIMVTLSIVNSITGITLWDGRGSSTNTPRLVFHRGETVDTRECLIVDTSRVTETTQFSLTITDTNPPLNIGQLSTVSVSIIAVANSTILTQEECDECGSQESLYLTLLLVLSVLTGISLLVVLVTVIVSCCYCHRHRKHQNASVANPSAGLSATMIQNQLVVEENDSHNRTQTMTSLGSATYHSFRTHGNSNERRMTQQRNRAIRSMVITRDSDNESEDYLDLQPAAPPTTATPGTTTGAGNCSTHHYEEPVFKTLSSATLL